MKRAISLLLIAGLIMTLFSGCYFGPKHITDVRKYGKVDRYIDFPYFFPESVRDYTVNSYSYTDYSSMDDCYEIFLDLTVTEEQFDDLISQAKAHALFPQEKEAYYAEGYYEIVILNDSYSGEHGGINNVGWAAIEKVIYNPKTYHIVYECLNALDSGIYPLDEVAYFNRFGIDQVEYEESLADKN